MDVDLPEELQEFVKVASAEYNPPARLAKEGEFGSIEGKTVVITGTNSKFYLLECFF